MTFVATANVIELWCQTRFVDVDPGTLLDIEKTLKQLIGNQSFMPVHLYGNMVDIKKL